MKRYIHTVDAVFALILFCAFAVSMLMVLSTGANTYQGVRDSVERHFSEDTAVDYISMKTRHYNGSDVKYREYDGSGVLYFLSADRGSTDITAIFQRDGQLFEITAEYDDIFHAVPEESYMRAATAIVDIQSLVYETLDGDAALLKVVCTGTSGDAAETVIPYGGDGGDEYFARDFVVNKFGESPVNTREYTYYDARLGRSFDIHAVYAVSPDNGTVTAFFRRVGVRGGETGLVYDTGALFTVSGEYYELFTEDGTDSRFANASVVAFLEGFTFAEADGGSSLELRFAGQSGEAAASVRYAGADDDGGVLIF
ncbi:MAG: hypothetical protein LBS90_07570 [Oscillospiraceae bacterium]|jgi:hypothetical protein|nr:hypothetical protein [Oscillospiraceae bacterium]